MYPRRLCSCDQDTASGPMYVHAGLEGSVIALTNVLGELVEKYRYTAFGLLTVLDADGEEKATPALSPWLYHGRLYEESSGLYWMRMRHYSPQLGRFLQPDPAGIAGGINLYAYSNNNPLRYFDPWGLWPAPDASGGDDGEYGEADPDRHILSPQVAQGGSKPTFVPADVAAELMKTPAGQAFLRRIQSDFVIKTGEFHDVVIDPSTGRMSKGSANTSAVGGYHQGTGGTSGTPGLILINTNASSNGGFSGTDAQFYAYVLVQEVNEHDAHWGGATGNSKAREVQNRVQSEVIAQTMGLPEAQPGYRTASGAPNLSAISNDVNSNSGYQGATHGNPYYILNRVTVVLP